jgi:predicted DNA-binding protein (UPF0251 family)
MSTTVGLVSGLEAWRLVHEEGRPAKQAAALLGISISDLFDLLADERKKRDIAAHRAAALGLTQAQN